MRYSLAAFLALTVFVTAGFVFFAMNFNPECLSLAVENAACRGGSNVLDFLFFHVGIHQHASWAVVGTVSSALGLFLALGWVTAAAQRLEARPGFFSVTSSPILLPVRRDLRRWLSLHEKRDPAGS